MFLLFFNVFLIHSRHSSYNRRMFLFVQTRVGPILGTTGGKLIRPANFDKLIHQYEGEVGFFISESYLPQPRLHI